MLRTLSIFRSLFRSVLFFFFFFFNDTATTEIYTLSLHDALPISKCYTLKNGTQNWRTMSILVDKNTKVLVQGITGRRSEEHTSELQSHSFISYAVFCLKKKKKSKNNIYKKHLHKITLYHRTNKPAN